MSRRTTEVLALIDAPHFWCGIVLWNDKVIQTAPITRYMKGWTRNRVREYCKSKKWKVSVVSTTERVDA